MDDFLVMGHDEAKLVRGAFDSIAPEMREWLPKDMAEPNRKLVKTFGVLLKNLPEWHDAAGPARRRCARGAPSLKAIGP